MNYQKIVEDFACRLLASVETSRSDLKTVVKSASQAVGSAEASIMVLNEAQTHLGFLVSLNDKLDQGDVEIERHKAFSSFVFDSGQIVAKVKPDSEGAGAVYEKAGVRTDYLLAVPVMFEQQVIAVGTFVNRAKGKPDEGFMKKELDLAQQFAELYAVALNVHRQAVLAYRLACHQLTELTSEMEIDTASLDCLQHEHLYCGGSEESIFSIDQKLEPSERMMWRRFGEFLNHSSENELSD